LDLEANWQVIENQTKDDSENGEEYVGLTKTPYWNLMLDIRILKIEERLVRHMLFLPQEVVWWDVWTRGFFKRHDSR
jgi:hypothetical protein